MSISVISHSSANGLVAPNIDSSGADLLFAFVATGGGSPGAVTDNKGNSWTRLLTASGLVVHSIYVCIPISVGSGHTISCASGPFASIAVAAFSGLDQTGYLNGINGTVLSATRSPGSVSPIEGTELIVCGVATSSTGTYSIDSGFTKLSESQFVSGSYQGVSSAYKIADSTSAVSPTWSGMSGAAASAMAACRRSGGGGGSVIVIEDD